MLLCSGALLFCIHRKPEYCNVSKKKPVVQIWQYYNTSGRQRIPVYISYPTMVLGKCLTVALCVEMSALVEQLFSALVLRCERKPITVWEELNP